VGLGCVGFSRPTFGLWNGSVFWFGLFFLFVLGWGKWFFCFICYVEVCWLGWDEDGEACWLFIFLVGGCFGCYVVFWFRFVCVQLCVGVGLGGARS